MNLAWVVLRIDIGGGYRVDRVFSSEEKAREAVENIKKEFNVAHSLTYAVPFDVRNTILAVEEFPYDSKDIYLRRGEEIIGLHAVGQDNSEWDEVLLDGTTVRKKGFRTDDAWGNEYDENFNVRGRGSFRVFTDIEMAAQDLEMDGWVRFERKT